MALPPDGMPGQTFMAAVPGEHGYELAVVVRGKVLWVHRVPHGVRDWSIRHGQCICQARRWGPDDIPIRGGLPTHLIGCSSVVAFEQRLLVVRITSPSSAVWIGRAAAVRLVQCAARHLGMSIGEGAPLRTGTHKKIYAGWDGPMAGGEPIRKRDVRIVWRMLGLEV